MASIKERLIQVVMRGKDLLSGEAGKSAAALDELRQQGEALQAGLARSEGAARLARQLDQTRAAAERAATAYGKAQDDVVRLRAELDAAPSSKGLQAALREAERNARATGRELDALRAAEADLERQAREAGIATDRLADEQERLGRQTADAKRALDANAEAMDELRRKQAAAAAGAAQHASRVAAAREAMAGGTRQVLAYAAAYVSLDAAIGLAGRGIAALRAGIGTMLQVGDDAEAMQARMTSLMGSIAAGEQATAWIGEFAKATPLATAEVTDAFVLLKSYGLDPMDGTLQALVDKNEQLGGGMERLTGIVTAVGQAWAKGKLQGEEILQLVERGVPVWDTLARITGKNTAQLEALASQGRLGRDVIQALTAELGKSAEGAAAAGMSRLSGLMSQLSDTAKAFYQRIANAGALDFVKGKLQGVLDTLKEMDGDGRLDRLAESLSSAFIQGAEKAEALTRRLLDIDFARLTTESAAWLDQFGAKIGDATTRVQLFIAPFRTLFNGFTAGVSAAGAAFTGTWALMLQAVEALADKIPDALGGPKLKAGVAEARQVLEGLRDGLVEQIEQDGRDIRAAWDTTHAGIESASQSAADAQQAAAEAARGAWQKAADDLIADQQRARDATLQAALEGRTAITEMAQALDLIDSARSVDQLARLRDALMQAWKDGSLGQRELDMALTRLNAKLRSVQSGADATAGSFEGLADEFENLPAILQRIGQAANEVDFNQLRTGIRKAYAEGKISADDFAKAIGALNQRMADLKPTSERSTQAVRQQKQALDEAGQGMQQLAGGAAEAGAQMDFFGYWLTQAREPLAGLSAAALDAFDSLQGIQRTDLKLDTSSLDKTSESLKAAREQLGFLQRELEMGRTTAGGFGVWAMETLIRSEQIKVSYLQQKQALQTLMDGYERGGVSLDAFVGRARSARRNLDLLDGADLSGLESAIAGAEQRMRSLGDSTRNTLDGLRSELDQLRGDEAAVEARRFAQRRRDLQAQLAEARASGSSQAASNLSEALRVLRDVEAETERQRLTKQRDAAAQAAQANAPTTPQPAPAAPPPTTVVRLEAAGRSLDVQVPHGQQDALLDILGQAGLRTL